MATEDSDPPQSDAWPFWLERCDGYPYEKTKWYQPKLSDKPDGTLHQGKYICGAPELFLDSKALKQLDKLLPKKKFGQQVFWDGNWAYRQKPGTEVYLRDGKTDKEVVYRGASGLLVIVPQDVIKAGRYANAIRFELSATAKLYLKTRRNDFSVTLYAEGEPSESLFISN